MLALPEDSFQPQINVTEQVHTIIGWNFARCLASYMPSFSLGMYKPQYALYITVKYTIKFRSVCSHDRDNYGLKTILFEILKFSNLEILNEISLEILKSHPEMLCEILISSRKSCIYTFLEVANSLTN